MTIWYSIYYLPLTFNLQNIAIDRSTLSLSNIFPLIALFTYHL